ncbi:MAG: hypothetical protein WEA56_12900 [Balneolaceae bacterium]
MIAKLLYLNWKLFTARLTNLQRVLIAGYSLFLLVMIANLMGSALLVIFLDNSTQLQVQLPWLTPEIHKLILLSFACVFWVLHFSFTSTRLLNIEENRKLLAYGYPAGKLSWHLNLMALYHPLNVIYNLTWLVFLSIQINSLWNVPILVAAVLLNYGIIFSIKHRFLHMVERRFKIIVFSFFFVVFGVFSAMAIISRQTQSLLADVAIELTQIINVMELLPGGLLYQSAVYQHEPLLTGVLFFFLVLLTWLVFRDHYYKTLEGLQNPEIKKVRGEVSRLWSFLRRWLGHHGGKYYYYIMIHPYNKLQLLAMTLIPLVYIPLLLMVDFGDITTILIATMLAAIPVALLAMGMANMFGYEHRELLLHLQFPVAFEKQLKERFLGIITVPLFIFYGITIFELLKLPRLGTVFSIYIANTFFFLCFMLVFLWSSFYQYQKASYSTFSFKHPIIPQKVTFTMSAAIFILGYTIFVPLGEWQHFFRLWVMAGLIGAIGLYLILNIDVLSKAFKNRILKQLWNDF